MKNFQYTKNYSVEEVFDKVTEAQDYKLKVALEKVENFKDMVNYLCYIYRTLKTRINAHLDVPQSLDEVLDVEVHGENIKITIARSWDWSDYQSPNLRGETMDFMVSKKMIDEFHNGEPHKKDWNKYKTLERNLNEVGSYFRRLDDIKRLQKELNNQMKKLEHTKKIFDKYGIDDTSETFKNEFKNVVKTLEDEYTETYKKYVNGVGLF